MSQLLSCGLECPLDWVPLPVEPDDDVAGWVKAKAAEIVDRSREAGYHVALKTVRADLKERAQDSRGRDPFYAFALYPDGFDTALATLEVDLIHPDDEVPEITLDWLAEVFSAKDFGPPDIAHVDLPIGRSVKIRQNFAAKSSWWKTPGVLMESVIYGVVPKGTDSAVIALFSWTVPGIAESMEEAAESIVRTLVAEVG
ncbi:hypothetical protein [Streptomyces sp. NPDC059009]|uniref:hypothetical protein n=1 Tax=Streptomyces sp. NPDC059009 TaxID=3346694 RepID=UPI0036B2A4CE